MKGYIRTAATLLGWTLAAAAVQAQAPVGPACSSGQCITSANAPVVVGGCAECTTGNKACGRQGARNHNGLYDRCWFVRYSNLAHRSVNRAMTPQVQNGHVLEQTVWNHMFEPGTDVLNGLGLSHLQFISRRRPEVDRTIYLASAMDLQYDPACPDRFAGARQELDTMRVAAIQKYLVALNAGRGSDFQVLVHDPADVSISATPAASTVTQMYGKVRGGLGSGGAAAGPSGSVGGFAGAGGAASR